MKSSYKIHARIFTVTSLWNTLSRGLLKIVFFSFVYIISYFVHILLWLRFIPCFMYLKHSFVTRDTEDGVCKQEETSARSGWGCKLHVRKQELALSEVGRFWRSTASDTSSHNPSLDPESAFVNRHSQVVTVSHPVRFTSGVMDL